MIGLFTLSSSHAQITLHDVTNVTQTKATLSADGANGFQYKYGTLTTVDAFSTLALHALSDPVQITTTGNTWKSREVKGWVESASGLSAGQSSTMSATVTFTKSTTITFDWSVDSEEGIGTLSFLVDGTTVKSISGLVDFTSVSYTVSAGKHTLSWQYKKSAATNEGLDLGMVKSINLQNTTEGEWINVDAASGSTQITGLYPAQSYLCRAFNATATDTTYSTLSTFTTKSISISAPTVTPITQTTATVNATVDLGDAEADVKLVPATNLHKCSTLERALTGQDSTLIDFKYTGWNESSDNSYIFASTERRGQTITATFYCNKETTISFNYYYYYTNSGLYYFYLYVDGIQKGKYAATHSEIWKSQSITLSAGEHTLKWYKEGFYGTAYLKNLSVEGLNIAIDTVANLTLPYKLEELAPNTTYAVYIETTPKYESQLEKRWNNGTSTTQTFTTLNVSAGTPQAESVKQGSATIKATVDGGDAKIVATGLQYRDATGKRWTNYSKESTATELSQSITRLKPSTKYQYRSYIQAEGCDTVFSDIQTFTTLAVEALTPTIVTLTQHKAQLQGIVRFGDASIYQRGMQFRKYGESTWEEVEDGGEDSIYTLTKTNLELATKYEARTYIQPAGCDIIYSDILQFTTKDVIDAVTFSNITQTKATMKVSLDTSEDEVTDLKYSLNNGEYTACGNEVQFSGLKPNTQYTVSFEATVNGTARTWSSDTLRFTTKAVTIAATFSDITQTKATMKVTVDAGDAVVTDLKYRVNSGTYTDCGSEAKLSGLTPNTQYTVSFLGSIGGVESYWDTSSYKFTTLKTSSGAGAYSISQTSADMRIQLNYGDATYVGSAVEYGTSTAMGESLIFEKGESSKRLTELTPNTTYYYRTYIETEEGGKVYSSGYGKFTTSAITCTTSAVSKISNRSATMNGEIDCDSYSSAEFGFQWKSMTGWNSDPAFTKGVKNDDGSISVALVNGMLEPNTDYQYRAAVRYKNAIYFASSWVTFRTESEYVYYPASVYTIYRTDRENNRLVLCGYYVAGSETVATRGYEYWRTSALTNTKRLATTNSNVFTVTTDSTMQYELDLKTLQDGNYAVRAFVTTTSGTTTYGQTLSFGVEGGEVVDGIDDIESEAIRYTVYGNTLTIYNATSLSCTIYNLRGIAVAACQNMGSIEKISLEQGNIYIVRLSDGTTYKIAM